MIKVLFLAANPVGTPRLALDEEVRAIDAKIRGSEWRDQLDLIPHFAIRLGDLSGLLMRYRPEVVHFSGHGEATGSLVLHDEARDLAPTAIQEVRPPLPTAFIDVLRVLKDNIRVVVLNACYSAIQARAIVKEIDCAIGMSVQVGDSAAIAFAAEFYQALGYGESVKRAFRLGLEALRREGVASPARLARLHQRRGVDASRVILVAGRTREEPASPHSAPPPTSPPLSRSAPRLGPPDPILDDQTMPPDSPFYIAREADRLILAHLQTPGSTVTVKGPQKAGKSSLLARLHAWGRENSKASCHLSFRGMEAPQLANSTDLFQEIAQAVREKLDIDTDPAADWSANRGPRRSLTRFLERRVLARIDGPLQLLFDEADLTFPHPEACEDLFATLRFWHNERANDLDNRGWRRVGLIVAHSTDPGLWIRDLNQSPFNVGLRVVLDDFDSHQVAELNELYGRPLAGPEEVARLMALVGGHPYLVRLALYTMATRSHTLSQLERTATDQDSPFAPHLQRLLRFLLNDRALSSACGKILVDGTCDDEALFQRLWSAGLIRGETRDFVSMRYKLYETYFKKKRLQA
jgi:hypothetical protein